MNEDQILHYLYELEYATINNLYSRRSKTEKGSILATDKAMRRLENRGLVKPLPMNENPRNRRQEVFFRLTAKGAKKVDTDAKPKFSWESKSIEKINHDSMVNDIARMFLDSYEDVSLDFHAKIDDQGSYYNLYPDILATINGCTFLVEVERKKHPSRTVTDKLPRYESSKLEGLHPKTKVLFVWCNISRQVAMTRPQGQENIKGEITEVDRQYQMLLDKCRHLPPYKYRFLPFYKFHRLNEAVWDCPDGQKTKLINQ